MSQKPVSTGERVHQLLLTVVDVTWSLCHCCLLIASCYRAQRDANSCSPDYVSSL